MALEYAKLVLYALGFSFSLLVAGRLLTLHNQLAYLFSFVMLSWAINCVFLFSLLIYYLITGQARPDWSSGVFLINALLLSAAPMLLYSLFPGKEG